MQITLNVTNPEVEAPDLRLMTLEVFPEMTLDALRIAIEAEGIPTPSQHLYHNGRLLDDNSQTLQQLSIVDGDMLQLHVRDMRGSSGIAPTQREQHAAQRRPADSGGPRDPEDARLALRGNPQLRAQIQRSNPQLVNAIDDPQLFGQIYRQSENHEQEARLDRMRALDALNSDEFNPEAQAKIQEIIRQQAVMDNLQNAMEHHPEFFGRVHMLYLNVKVNGVKVKALVDSGAQATIMSPAFAEACNIMHLVDKRFAGIARGVGTANIIGRVHYTTLQIASKHLPAAFTVMEGKQVDFLLGLDILKSHQAVIDLARNKLVIQGEEVEFLGESDIPKETEDAVNQEPTVAGPGGTTIGTRSGAISGPSAPSQPSTSVAGPSAPIRAPPPAAPAASTPPQTQPQATTAFSEKDIDLLIGLGLNREAAIHALEAADGNVEFAAGLLFQG